MNKGFVIILAGLSFFNISMIRLKVRNDEYGKQRKHMGIEKIKEIQEKRIEKFPEDRIPFYSGGTAAQEDRKNMMSYQRGEIGIQRLCRLIEKSNFLPEDSVSPEMMRNELRQIGYARVSDRK